MIHIFAIAPLTGFEIHLEPSRFIEDWKLLAKFLPEKPVPMIIFPYD
jgi:hypothetical protein